LVLYAGLPHTCEFHRGNSLETYAIFIRIALMNKGSAITLASQLLRRAIARHLSWDRLSSILGDVYIKLILIQLL